MGDPFAMNMDMNRQRPDMAGLESLGPSPSTPSSLSTSLGANREELADLLALARRKTSGTRSELGGRIAQYLIAGADLSSTERDLVDGILSQLIREIEIQIRHDLAHALAQDVQAPPNLIRLLAADEIEIARPVLLASPILTHSDLLDIANRLSEQHRQVLAERPNLPSIVGDALVEFGEEPVIITLLHNSSAQLSQEALAYLVATSKQVEPFREPLLSRADLPPKLAYRMFWFVSAALRQRLLTQFDVPAQMIDGAMARLTPPNEETMMARAAHLFRGQNRQAGLGLHDLIGYLQEGRAALFIAAMAEILVISADTARRLVLDPGGEGLALICRAAGFPAPMFRRMLENLDENLGVLVRDPDGVVRVSDGYENLSVDRALRTIKFFDTESVTRAA
jgi:uncharacterized protein (DUF2336 family)